VSGDPLLPGLAGEIDDLYLIPDARGRSLGRRLADTAIARLRNAGAAVVSAQVDADDQDAHRFLEGLGFKGDTVRFSLYPDGR
jgi:ribosomal protein S18 acetylase RimI-like enzyme